MKMTDWNELTRHLIERSKEICQDNDCTEDEHFCESNAYITECGELIDICATDFFQGWGQDDIDAHGQYAVVALPFNGNGKDLKKGVEDNLPLD